MFCVSIEPAGCRIPLDFGADGKKRMDPFYQAPHCWVVAAFTKGSWISCKIHFNKKCTMVRPYAMRKSGKIRTKKWL